MGVFGSPDSVLYDSDLLIRYCLIRISWFGTNSIRNGWFGMCICNCYLLTLRWNWWRHGCVHSTNLLTPIEILIHWAQWSCSCYTSLVFSPGRSLLECHDAWRVLRALLLGGSKMWGCQPVYTNDYFTTRTVSLSSVRFLPDGRPEYRAHMHSGCCFIFAMYCLCVQ